MPVLEPCCAVKDHFTKTGSGQTKENSKRDADFSHAPGALLGVWLKSMLNCSGMSNAQGGL